MGLGRILKSLFFATACGFGEVDFQKEIRPILSDKCFACHGFDEETREADLRLDTQEGAFTDLGGYLAISPGKPEESEVYLRITSLDRDEVMPPPEAHKKLTTAEIALIKKWIESGAPYEDHWAYQVVQKHPSPDGREIDFLIERKLSQVGLKPSQEAAPIDLLRRISWDLRGVPPTAEETAQFLAQPDSSGFEKWVDHFLADPKFGERMAVWWLDLVRYADTIGYHSDNEMKISPYRDYVISAFNQNKSFADFTIEQLAGDLLPEPTLEQRIASGYNRLLQTTEEGGAQEKEYRAIYAADRVRNVSEVWLGSTLGCAQCHDHKFDPFTMRDFYSMAAFFADVAEVGIGKRRPNLAVPTKEQRTLIEKIEKQIELGKVSYLLKHDAAFRERLNAGREKWLKQEGFSDLGWRVAKVSGLQTPEGTELNLQDDGSLLETGVIANQPVYRFEISTEGRVTGLRIEAMTDPSFPVKGGFSRGNGNIVLTEVGVQNGGENVKISKVFADTQQQGYPASAVLDGDEKTGWAVGAHLPAGRTGTRQLVLVFEHPVDLKKGQRLEVRLSHQSEHHQHSIGRFRLSATSAVSPSLKMPEQVPDEILRALKAKQKTPAQEQMLEDYYLKVSPEVSAQNQVIESLESELKKINEGLRKTLVTVALETPRTTRILPRGNWLDESGEVVEPAVPEFLQKYGWESEERQGRATRLDLAHWILSEGNPLSGRAVVNRLWYLFFGRGVSADVTDLGGQGTVPSNPELLDWLAADFREHGWDLKRLVRQILTSRAYRQASSLSSFAREKDPLNNYFARQGRWRVDAEFVRDGVLQISGLLQGGLQGGESIKPYQPAGYWQHLNFPRRTWVSSEGEDLYRRSVYTFWCRTFLHPSMLAFDASSREECSAQRARSNIPQQALVMLNDPIFVEAARVFGQQMRQIEGGDQKRLLWGFRQAFSRDPSGEELSLLTQLLQSQRQRFATDQEAAKALMSVGQRPVEADAPVEEFAAWAQVGRAMINTYEATSRF